ncbi:hypothetical protein BT63DRAFT_53752 [Microthyrium microscopicum]|uniref:Uncharacterized protein n=1 Tax=Microthyrium microscopicum TaxID=703497 RepID=A0A6A6U1S9_9PEZI|nr:hypothetical protein BT63DRAFT_53752 [Microthyrium microscopicum]
MRQLCALCLSLGLVASLTVPEAVEQIQRGLLTEETRLDGTPTVAVRAVTASSMQKTTWDPPKHLLTPLKTVWDSYTWEKKYTNWAFQQIYANEGRLSFCVKWDSSKKITRNERSTLNKELAIQIQKWIDVLAGYDGWKYPKVRVRIKAWAAKEKANLVGLDAEAEKFTYHGSSCDKACYRYEHKDGHYTQCPEKKKGHFDMILNLRDNLHGGGSGQDFGQTLGSSDILKELKSTDPDRMHIFLHEMGHSFGLDDFYNPENTNNKRKPDRSGSQSRFLMKAGSAVFITEYDAWMMRNMWSCNGGPQLRNIPVPTYCT